MKQTVVRALLTVIVFALIGAVPALAQDDITPPQINVTTPSQYQTVSGSIQIQASITDESISHYYLSIRNAQGVVVGGTSTIYTSSSPATINYTFDTTTVADANYRIVISAADIHGNTSTKNRYISVVNEQGQQDIAPDVKLTSSPQSALLTGTVNFTATVLDTNLSHYYLIIKNSQGVIVGGPGIVYEQTPFFNKNVLSWDTTSVADGTYTVNFAARDLAGNQDDNSRVNMELTIDNNAPSIAFSSLTNNQTVSGSVDINATLQDENLSHYYLVIRNVQNQKVAGPGTVNLSAPVTNQTLMNWDTNAVTDGSYLVKLSVADMDGHSTLKTLLLNVNNQGAIDDNAPTIWLSQPTEYLSGSLSVSAGVLDNDLAAYRITITDQSDSEVYTTGLISSTAGFTSKEMFTWDSTAFPDGQYTLKMTAADTVGHTALSQHTFTVDNTAPEVEVYVPSLTIGFIALHTDINDANLSHYYLAIRNSEGTVVSGPGQVSLLEDLHGLLMNWNYSGLTRGYYTVELSVADKAGNTSSDELEVYVFGL